MLALGAVGLVFVAGAGAVILRQSRDLDERITSVALQSAVHARVVLPPGYETSGKRYPAVHFLGLHCLVSFSVIESWSGYFHPTDPSGTVALPRGPAASAHRFVRLVKTDEDHRATLLAFYVG